MNIREQHPKEIVERVLIIEWLRRVADPADIKAVNPKFVFEIEEEDGSTGLVFDYEFALLDAILAELKFVGNKIGQLKQLRDSAVSPKDAIASAQELDKRTLKERGIDLGNSQVLGIFEGEHRVPSEAPATTPPTNL